MAQIKKDTSLRKSILQAAITGKLKIDNGELKDEETSKELLDRIIEERNAKALAEWEEARKTNPKNKFWYKLNKLCTKNARIGI